MSLLFWYLPFMIMSGAYDAFYQSEVSKPKKLRVAEAENARKVVKRFH
jgi:hypothetical protein